MLFVNNKDSFCHCRITGGKLIPTLASGRRLYQRCPLLSCEQNEELLKQQQQQQQLFRKEIKTPAGCCREKKSEETNECNVKFVPQSNKVTKKRNKKKPFFRIKVVEQKIVLFLLEEIICVSPVR